MFGFEVRIRGVRNDKIEQQKTRGNEPLWCDFNPCPKGYFGLS